MTPYGTLWILIEPQELQEPYELPMELQECPIGSSQLPKELYELPIELYELPTEPSELKIDPYETPIEL